MRCGRWKSVFAKRRRRLNAEVAEKSEGRIEIPRGSERKMAFAGFLFIVVISGYVTILKPGGVPGTAMPIFSRLTFETVKWRARRGLSGGEASVGDEKEVARRRGVRGETFAYCYLRRHGYVFFARNYVPRGAKGEIDLVDTTARRGPCRSSNPNGA